MGCTTGYTLNALRSPLPGVQLTGTEPYHEGLAVARERWPNIRLMQADALALPFASEFDLVSALDGPEHVDDDAAPLSEIAESSEARGEVSSSQFLNIVGCGVPGASITGIIGAMRAPL